MIFPSIDGIDPSNSLLDRDGDQEALNKACQSAPQSRGMLDICSTHLVYI